MQSTIAPKFDADFPRNFEINYAKPIVRSPTRYEAYNGFHTIERYKRTIERIPKSKMNEKKTRELIASMKVTHPNILVIHEWYADEMYIYFSYESCHEMNLQEFIKSKLLKDTQAAIIARQILLALNYCYGLSLIYEGLSTSQIFFPFGYEALKVKIANPEITNIFNSCTIGKQESSELPYYKSPEELNGKPTLKSSMWSLGAITYRMIVGKNPFEGKNPVDIEASIGKGSIKFSQSVFSSKPDCQDFLARLLTTEDKRMTPEEALKHPWIVTSTEEFVKKEASVSPTVVKSLVRFSNMEALKRVLITFLVSTLGNKELESATKTFTMLDKNSDGKLVKEEIKSGIKDFAEAKNLLEFLETADTDKNGYIDYREFCVAALGSQICSNKEKITKGFEILDKDKNGFITPEKLFEALKPTNNVVSHDELRRLIEGTDLNRDGKISLKELQTILKEK